MNQRNLVIDLSKAIGIILVAIGHFIPEGAPDWYAVLRQWIYGFHMPLFLFISGYVYWMYGKRPYDKRVGKSVSYGQFLIGKLKRLIAPYLFFSAIVITLKLLSLGNAYLENPVTPIAYLRMFWRPEAGLLYWYVWALFTFMIVVPILKTKQQRLIAFGVAVVLHYLIVLKMMYGYFDSMPELPTLFSFDQSCRMFIWFMMGLLFSEHRHNFAEGICGNWIINSGNWRVIALILFVLITVCFCFCPAFDEGTWPALLLPYCGMAGVFAIASYMRKSQRIIAMLLPIGEASYFIYLSHTIFMGFAKSLLFTIVPQLVEQYFILTVLIVVGTGIAVPMALYYCMKKLTSNKLKL